MASSISGNYNNFMSSISAAANMPAMMNYSALTSGNLSTADTATLSKVLGSDYQNYQNMLATSGASPAGTTIGITGMSETGITGNGVKATEDGIFDFATYFKTYFPNLSDEEVSSLTAQYTEAYNDMFKQIGGALDMSNLAKMAMGTGDLSSMMSGNYDMDSIMQEVKDVSGNSASFDVQSYLKTYFPNLSNSDVSSLTKTYQKQVEEYTKK